MAFPGHHLLKPFVQSTLSTLAICTFLAAVLAPLVPAMGGFVITWVHALAIGMSAQILIRGGLQLLWRANQPHPLALAVLYVSGMVAAIWIGAHIAGAILEQPTDWLTDSSAGILVPAALATLAGTSVLVSIAFMRKHTQHLQLQAELEQARADAAVRLADEAQLRMLRAQLEPHMLFNTLATLRALISVDALRAQTMLDHMVTFLRATLNASRNDTLPLVDEFVLIEDYLSLMHVRLGPRLTYHVRLADAVRLQQVPPLLVEPVVENAIRHAIEPMEAGGHIGVEADLQHHAGETQLCITVTDNGAGITPHADDVAYREAHAGGAMPVAGGFGLEAVRSRLRVAYGDRASLRLQSPWPQDAAGGARVELRLPVALEET